MMWNISKLELVCSCKYVWIEKSWKCIKKCENVEILNILSIHLNGETFLENVYWTEYFGKFKEYEKSNSTQVLVELNVNMFEWSFYIE